MKHFMVVVCLGLLYGCGPDTPATVLVEHKLVPKDYIEDTCGPNSVGCAFWINNHSGQQYRECTIYTMHEGEYVNDLDYHRVLGHELKHCMVGNFH
jgi:hypothetical protein